MRPAVDFGGLDRSLFSRFILGIDPGMAESGWAAVGWTLHGAPVVIRHGVCRTRPGRLAWDRVGDMVAQLVAVERALGETHVGMEEWIHRRVGAATTAHSMGLVIGGLLVGLASRPVSVGDPATWHKRVGLPPSADKAAVMRWVRAALPLETPPATDHEFDAIAIALAAFDLIPTVGGPR